ncbi:YadA-like family protein, partial [uncultured Anaerovibrio sp.]|uniref:YadA-like family protein n=1 Tax=uncultured Anaerovibrio sp. TaxID=361586 RepID=UPI002626AE3E
ALGGTTAEAAVNSLAVGLGAQTTLSDSIALGSGAVADRAKYDGTDNPYTAYLGDETGNTKTGSAWRATANAIAIGHIDTGDDANSVTRQITGVAAGSEDTDAVNVAQLKEATVNIEGSIKVADGNYNYISAGTDVAGNLTALDTQVKANADAIQAGNEALTTKGITFKGDSGTSGPVKLDGELAVTGDSNIATAASAGKLSVSLNKDVDLGSTGSMTVGKSVLQDSGLVITDGTKVTSVTSDGINAGGNKITNVANGTDTNDAVNYGQVVAMVQSGGTITGVGDGLSASNGQLSVNAGGGLTFDNSGQLQVNTGDDLSVDTNGKLQVNKGGQVASGNTGIVTGGTVFDALEGVKSQVTAATETALAGKADKATTLSGYGITDAYTKTETDTMLDQKADKATTLSGYGITDAYTKTETDTQLSQKADKATTLSGYGITDAYTKTETDTQLTQKADKADSLSGYGITDAYTKTETDTQLSQKADKADTLSGYGITDAYTKTDVDKKLETLTSVSDISKGIEVINNVNEQLKGNEEEGLVLGSDSTKLAMGKGSEASGEESISIGNAVGSQMNVASGTESIAIGFANQVSGNHSGAFGDPDVVTGNSSYAFGNDNTISADKTFVLGNNVNATGTNSVVLGDGSDGSESNVVSVGAEGNERRITHVAAGQSATDAATVGQVYSVAQSVNNLDNRINKVGAGAAALAALHPMDLDGKFGVGIGYGNYHSASAVALGMFYQPTDNMMMSVGGTIGNGENMVNMGLSIALDKPSPTSKKAMAKKIAVQEAQLAQQSELLAAQDAELKAQDAELKAQKKEIEALKEALLRLEAKISG